ncbi:MAG: glycoside hydrolase family 25 protein [Rhizobiales bacterium]|nr:glycoside hydrolase family 25 protein [Hyphomicrobiales bacterium]
MKRGRTFLAALAALAGCTTADLSPVGETSEGTISASVAVAYPRFDDSDPHDWQARKPTQYAVHGTDVSKYQASVDWARARDSGVSFAFVKATEGADRLDDMFMQHWSDTRAAGVPRGAYHFYYFCRTAAEQAAWYIRNVPRERGAMPPVLDMEWNPHSPTCKLRPPAETVRSQMKAFLEIVERHYGKKPIIYTSIDFFEDNDLATFKGYPFWLRSVAGHPEEKYGSHPFTFWQYTGTGVIPGIRGKADLSVFNGSPVTWTKWIRANTK